MGAPLTHDQIEEALERGDFDALADDMAQFYPPAFCDRVRRLKSAGRPRSPNTKRCTHFLIVFWERCAAINADTEQRVRIGWDIAEELGVDEDLALELIDGKRPRVTRFAKRIWNDKRRLGTPYPWESPDK